MKKKKNITKRIFLKFFGAIAATGILIGGVALGSNSTEGANKKDNFSLLSSSKTSTFGISALCPSKELDANDVDSFINADFDCTKAFGIQSKDEVLNNKNAFLKITPILTLVSSLKINFSSLTSQPANFDISKLIFNDLRDGAIPSSAYTITTEGPITSTNNDVSGSLNDNNVNTVVSVANTAAASITVNFSPSIRLSSINVVTSSESSRLLNVTTFDNNQVQIINPITATINSNQSDITNINDFKNGTTSEKLKSYLKKVTLLNDNQVVGYELKGSQLFFPNKDDSPDAKTCDSELDCSSKLQFTGDTEDYINLEDESVFFIEARGSFNNLSLVGKNILAEVSYRRKENLTPSSITDFQALIPTAPTTTSESINSLELSNSNISLLTCDTLIRKNLAWAYPKACDFIEQVWPHLDDDLKGEPTVQNLDLKGSFLGEYPLWDVQRVMFNSTGDTSLTLDFDSYLSDQDVFNANSKIYIEEFFKRNASSLKSLSIKGPINNDLATYIGNLSSLENLTLDGTIITNFSFLSLLPSLKKLSINNNKLEDTSVLENVSQTVTEINLSNNKISSVPVAAFNNRPSLTTLNLSNNNIDGLVLENFANLSSLKNLNLSSNNFSTLPDFTASLTSLETLDVSNNNITSLQASIIRLQSLRNLLLNNNKLTSLPAIAAPSSITTLDLRNNDLNILNTIDVSYPNLVSLSFGGASFELNMGADSTNLPTLKTILTNSQGRLTELKIENMNLTNATAINLLNFLGTLTSSTLTKLSLENNQLENITLEQVTTLPTSIKELNLSDQTSLTAIPTFLSGLTNLEKLYLRDNSIVVPQTTKLPETLNHVDLSGNPIASISRTLTTLKDIDEIVLKRIDKEIGENDWKEIAENISDKEIKVVVSSNSFVPQELYVANNFFSLRKFNLYVEENNVTEKVSLQDQFLLNYENNVAKTLKSQLKLKDFDGTTLRNYISENQRVYYKRPAFDSDNINSEEKLKTFLESTWNSATPVARKFQLDQSTKEVKDAFDEAGKINVNSFSGNDELIAALTLTIVILLINTGVVILYIFKNKKKK